MTPTAIQQSILTYLQFKAHADNTIRGNVMAAIISHTGKGEVLITRSLDELVAAEYLSRSENPIGYEILTNYKWGLSFGTPRTFKSREEGRDYIAHPTRWGIYDPAKRNHRPEVVRNQAWKAPGREGNVTLIKVTTRKKKKPYLEGKDPLTVALNAVVEIATLPGIGHAHSNYHKQLAVEVLEAVEHECQKTEKEKCDRKECAKTCWAKKTISSFTPVLKLSA